MAIDRTRQKRSVTVISIHYSLDGSSLDDAIKYLKRLKKDYPDGYLSWDFKRDYDGSDRHELNLETVRDETDEEMAKRIKTAEDYEARQRASDEAAYARLKKQFEGK